MADKKQFFHIFSYGSGVESLTGTEKDFRASFNRVGICAARVPRAGIVSFSIVKDQIHFLTYGTPAACYRFLRSYRTMSLRYLLNGRLGYRKGAVDFEMCLIDDDRQLEELRNICSRFITGMDEALSPEFYRQQKIYLLTRRQYLSRLGSKWQVPDEWVMVGNYLSHRNYLCRSRLHPSCNITFSTVEIDGRMKRAVGLALPREEAARLTGELCLQMFALKDPRSVDEASRLALARCLRMEHGLNFKQTALCCRVSELKVRKLFW